MKKQLEAQSPAVLKMPPAYIVETVGASEYTTPAVLAPASSRGFHGVAAPFASNAAAAGRGRPLFTVVNEPPA